MGVIYEKERVNILALKGAPDMTLDNCTTYIDENGVKKPVDEQFKRRLEEAIA